MSASAEWQRLALRMRPVLSRCLRPLGWLSEVREVVTIKGVYRSQSKWMILVVVPRACVCDARASIESNVSKNGPLYVGEDDELTDLERTRDAQAHHHTAAENESVWRGTPTCPACELRRLRTESSHRGNGWVNPRFVFAVPCHHRRHGHRPSLIVLLLALLESPCVYIHCGRGAHARWFPEQRSIFQIRHKET
jgi:hypothetical protein